MPETLNANLMPTMALRGLVVFPGMVLHFDVGREKSIKALNIAMEKDQTIFLVTQKDIRVENPNAEDLYSIGCVAKIRQIMRLADDNIRVLIEGKKRATFSNLQTLNNCLISEVETISSSQKIAKTANNEALIRNVKELFSKYATLIPKMPKDISLTVQSSEDPAYLSDYIAANIHIPYEDKQTVLEELNPIKRLKLISRILNKESTILGIDAKINEKTKEFIDENQKDYYLKEQLRAINFELYGDDGPDAEIEEYRNKIEKCKAPDSAKKIMLSEVAKLSKMPFGSHEATVVRNYLDLLLSLPFNVKTKIKTNITKAAALLNKEHYGLEKVKERILEVMAVYALKPDNKGQIICLSGPPGVGKTSIARSLATSMGRNFARVSLGGIHDEAEINGHRRTYIGAMPGRIINAIKKAGSSNPLILLDEIDKMAADIKGDPASALLEVLDSEQNNSYVDHYVDMPYDLSDVLFICTANDVHKIPAPLLDRMDLIEIPGYTRFDKFNICTNYLIKKQLDKHGISSKNFKIEKSAVYDIIDYYTKEAGVRSLERRVCDILRKSAKKIVAGQKNIKITSQNLEEFLGIHKYRNENLLIKNQVGVVNGLAWTSVGGEIMQIEAAVMNGTGKLELTGSLGEVMQESAKAAVSYARANALKFNIDPDFYKNKDIHIHATEAAVPKDGPSAGVTIATALISALTERPVKQDIAMTGEISIRGRVFAIGGLTEKVMAAVRAGISLVIIPKENEKDINEIPEEIRKNIKFFTAENVDEVIEKALEHQLADEAIKIESVNKNYTLRT